MTKLSISKLKELKSESKLSPDFLKSYCFIVLYSNQYATGLTGITYKGHVYIKSENEGFRLVKEGRNSLKEAGIISINKNSKSSPYGNIGQVIQTIKAVKIAEFLDSFDRTSYSRSPFYIREMTVLEID